MPKVSVTYGYIEEHCDWELFCKLIDRDKYILIDGLVKATDVALISLEIAYAVGVLFMDDDFHEGNFMDDPTEHLLYSYPSLMPVNSDRRITSTGYIP